MTKFIKEAAGGAGTLTGARSTITLITPGWGSSGYYSAEVLAKAAEDKVFPAGTQMHIDHSKEDGVGSVGTLAAVLETDARWEPNWKDPKTGEKGRLAAENKVFSDWSTKLLERKDTIGVSIASAAEMSLGEAEGRQGRIIEALLPSPLNRVDYVTVAGRGGHISEVLESATPEQLATEATARELSELLSAALKEAYAGNGVWVWLRDHDDTNVWFERESDGAAGIFQESYVLDGNTVTLSGQAIEVRVQTSYVPVSADSTESMAREAVDLPAVGDRIVIDPDSVHDPAHTTGTIAEIGSTAYGVIIDGMPEMGIHRWYTAEEFDYADDPADMGMEAKKKKRRKKKPMAGMKMSAESKDSPPNPAGVTEGKEPVVGTIQIEESAHAALVEKSGRVTALEADVTKATERATAAESSLTEANDTAAEALVTAALEAAGVSAPKLAARLAKGYPVKENGVLDAEALRTDVAESVAELQVSNGAGSVRGVGHTQEEAKPAETVTAEQAKESILAVSGYTPKGAK